MIAETQYDEVLHGDAGPADVLIGILHAGEQEFDACIRALSMQTYRCWTAFVLRDRPNEHAHRDLYTAFHTSRNHYRYFIKLDADMVFVDDDAMRRGIEFVDTQEGVERVEFAVRDWFTDRLIMGLSFYTGRAQWPTVLERIFVDRHPTPRQYHRVVWTDPAPLVDHAPNPSLEQSIAFGVHRAIKVVQPGSHRWLIGDGLAQWRVLERVAEHYRATGDQRLAAVLAAAARVLRGGLTQSPEGYKRIARDIVSTPVESLVLEAEAFWLSTSRARVEALRSVGLRRTLFGLLHALVKRGRALLPVPSSSGQPRA